MFGTSKKDDSVVVDEETNAIGPKEIQSETVVADDSTSSADDLLIISDEDESGEVSETIDFSFDNETDTETSEIKLDLGDNSPQEVVSETDVAIDATESIVQETNPEINEVSSSDFGINLTQDTETQVQEKTLEVTEEAPQAEEAFTLNLDSMGSEEASMESNVMMEVEDT